MFSEGGNTIKLFSPQTFLKNTMKKFFALCAMIVALGFVAGCPGGGESPAPSPAPADTAPADGDGGNGSDSDNEE